MANMRSRFFRNACNCNMTPDNVWTECIAAAQTAMHELGRAHSERAYEECMANYFYHRRIPYMRQRQFFQEVQGEIIPVGVADLEVAHSVILELKAGNVNINDDHKAQLLRYMHAARNRNKERSIMGGVLLFGKDGALRVWEHRMPLLHGPARQDGVETE